MSLYIEASQILDNEDLNSGSLRSIVYSKYEHTKNLKAQPKQVFALLSSALRYKQVLKHVIKASQILKVERKLNMPIAILMCHDLLMTKAGRITTGKGPLKDAVLRHKTRLKAELTKYKIKHSITSLATSVEKDESPIRWIRVNTIKSDDNKVLEVFHHLKVVDSIQEVVPGTIYKDEFVPHLYGLHPSEAVTNIDLYKKGGIIIQDRASCFPATILSPVPGSKLIDACSAPGNKTSHLASYVQNRKDSITAFERDKKRSTVLRKMIETAGALNCVNIVVQDFTASDPSNYQDVTGILVDPSCSGSGIFGRYQDSKKSEEMNEDRLQNLAEFQYKIVRHAMSFPNAETIVYSTCSIHAQENEHVVKRLLQDPHVINLGWRVRDRARVLPSWTRRGIPEELEGLQNQHQVADGCIRVVPKIDGGIGFFAVCFEKIP